MQRRWKLRACSYRRVRQCADTRMRDAKKGNSTNLFSAAAYRHTTRQASSRKDMEWVSPRAAAASARGERLSIATRLRTGNDARRSYRAAKNVINAEMRHWPRVPFGFLSFLPARDVCDIGWSNATPVPSQSPRRGLGLVWLISRAILQVFAQVCLQLGSSPQTQARSREYRRLSLGGLFEAGLSASTGFCATWLSACICWSCSLPPVVDGHAIKRAAEVYGKRLDAR